MLLLQIKYIIKPLHSLANDAKIKISVKHMAIHIYLKKTPKKYNELHIIYDCWGSQLQATGYLHSTCILHPFHSPIVLSFNVSHFFMYSICISSSHFTLSLSFSLLILICHSLSISFNPSLFLSHWLPGVVNLGQPLPLVLFFSVRHSLGLPCSALEVSGGTH